MAIRKAPPTTATSPAPAIIRCSCSISSAIWNAPRCVLAMSIVPMVGRTCWGRSWPAIGAGSSVVTFAPMRPLQIQRSMSSWRLNTTTTRSGCLPIRFFSRRSSICSSALLVVLRARSAGTTPTFAIKHKAGRHRAAWWHDTADRQREKHCCQIKYCGGIALLNRVEDRAIPYIDAVLEADIGDDHDYKADGKYPRQPVAACSPKALGTDPEARE